MPPNSKSAHVQCDKIVCITVAEKHRIKNINNRMQY